MTSLSITERAGVPIDIADALDLAEQHHSVREVRATLIGRHGVLAEIAFDAELPSRYRAAGQSPVGVRSIEVATFLFDESYPLTAPKVTLRPDFNRTLPHINPHVAGSPVPPCILFGGVEEAFHRSGFSVILDQTAAWIRNAGRGELVKPEQGWEPIRRDELGDIVAFNAAWVRSLVGKKAGYEAHQSDFFQCFGADGKVGTAWSAVRPGKVAINPRTLSKLLQCGVGGGDIRDGISLAVVCWPGKEPSGTPTVCTHYMPETVVTIRDLRERAREYGCGEPLDNFLSWVGQCTKGYRTSNLTVPIIVILIARRPWKLIGTDSDLEAITYRFDAGCPAFLPNGHDTLVVSASHRHVLNEEVLRQMSGIPATLQPPVVTMLGCGSIGSKLALHMARAALTPTVLVDMRVFDAHHMARHALLPRGTVGEAILEPSKSRALATALGKFGREVRAVTADVCRMQPGDSDFQKAFPECCRLVVNSTGSHVVRDKLATTSGLTTRVVEAALLDRGRFGLFSLEGKDRNPDTLDLAILAYEELRASHGHSALSGASAPDAHVSIGQGCEAVTMVMTDARVSMYAAPIADRLIGMLSRPLSDKGELLLGHLGDDDMSLTWRRTEVGPTHRVVAENDRTWTVHVLERAHLKMLAELERHLGTETGGVIVGRVSPVRRLMHVTDVLDATPDSRRLPATFMLGVEGLAERITEYERSAAGVLWCLGTWHSHLADQGGSVRDYATAQKLAGSGRRAVALLICRPGGYSAIVVPGGTS